MRPDGRSRLTTLLDVGRHAEAREVALALLAEEPGDAVLHGELSRALFGLEDWPGALVAANRSVGLAPASAWGHRLCAMALLRLGQPREAARATAEAVRLQPDDAVNHEIHAQVLVDVPGAMPVAWRAALHTVHLAPDDADSHFTVGYVAGRRHDAATARRAYERALAIDPEHSTALHNLALVTSGSSLRRRADGIAGALRLDPQRREFRENAEVWADRVVRRAWLGSIAALLFATLAGWGGLAGLVLLGWWWRRLMRQVPPGMRRLVRARVPRSPYLALVVLLTAATCVAAVVVAVLPGESSARWAVTGTLLWPTLALGVWTLLRRR